MSEDKDKTPIEYSYRMSLGEKAFRRYEVYIAIASHGTYVLNPANEHCGRAHRTLTQHSLACGLRDAILGFYRYGYISRIIDKSFEYESIKILEDPDSPMVEVRNTNSFKTLSRDEVKTLRAEYETKLHEAWKRDNAQNDLGEGLTL